MEEEDAHEKDEEKNREEGALQKNERSMMDKLEALEKVNENEIVEDDTQMIMNEEKGKKEAKMVSNEEVENISQDNRAKVYQLIS